MRQLYLVRHPSPDVSPGICYGATDLLPAGRIADAATRVRAKLPAHAPIYSSPLRRCRLLAQTLSAQAVIEPRLAEINFGRWEMKPWGNIPLAELDAWAANPLSYQGHGGESVATLQARVRQFLATLPQGDSVLITHGGVMKVIYAQVLNLPPDDWLNMHFDYASVTRLEMPERGNGRLVWHNNAHA